MLTGKQRAYLKALATELEPSVYIGKQDLTETVLAEMDRYLDAHEILKVKIQEGSELDPKAAANDAAAMLGAEYVQAIGRRFVLYRQAKEKADRKIMLPK